jgi:hypothetical protein
VALRELGLQDRHVFDIEAHIIEILARTIHELSGLEQ